MSASPAPARQGRPKDPAKRAAIIAAAFVLFGRLPYDAVTMEAVALEAGVSKMTIYSHFTDKETLFETIVLTVSSRLLAAFSAPAGSDGALAERLAGIGIGFLTIILSPEVVGMATTLSTPLRNDRALAQRFYDAGPGRVEAALAAIIESAASAGELRVDGCEGGGDVGGAKQAAEDLISLWTGSLQTEISFGLVQPVTSEEIDRRVRRGTEVFLRAYANAAAKVGAGSAEPGSPAGKTPSRRRRA